MVSSGRYAISSILLVLSTVIIAQVQGAPDKTSGATITGKVTIKGQGAPGIAVVLVQNVEGRQRPTRHRAFTDGTGTQFDQPGSYRSAEVDARGQFVAEGLLPGTYEVTAHSYAPNDRNGQIFSGKQQVTVTDGAVVNITVTLQPLSFSNRP